MLKLRARIPYGVALNLQVPKREDQIPVGALHLRDDINRAATKVCVRLFEPFTLDAYLTAVVVNRTVAQERLRDPDR